jgi:hypothetical protein
MKDSIILDLIKGFLLLARNAAFDTSNEYRTFFCGVIIKKLVNDIRDYIAITH